MRAILLTSALISGVALSALGCAGEVQSEVTVVPPKPVAQPALPADADGDGVADAADQCPKEREDGAGPLATDGCAAQDADGDGGGAGDRCPTEKETKNGFEDDDGCADELPTVRLSDHHLTLNGEVAFGAFGMLARASEPPLDDLAKWLGEHPEVELVEVAAHVQGAKTPPGNQSASSSRAGTVVDALVKRGVDRGRLQSTGYGDRCKDAAASDGREHVRVAFTVIKQGGQETGAKVGCPES
jgi:OOP family OmpA-OmpF porin